MVKIVSDTVGITEEALVQRFRGLLRTSSRIITGIQTETAVFYELGLVSRIANIIGVASKIIAITRISTTTRIITQKVFVSRIINYKSFKSYRKVILFVSRIRTQIPYLSRIKMQETGMKSRISLIKSAVSRIRNIFKSE